MNASRTEAPADSRREVPMQQNVIGASPAGDKLSVVDLDNPLLSIVQALAACKDTGSLATTLARSARALVGADGVTVVMREGTRCRYLEEDAIGALWKGQAFPLEECISGLCITAAQAVVIEDIRCDARIPQALYAPTFVRGMAMAPIGRDEPVGALGLYWSTPRRATEADLKVLWALADLAAFALRNLWLIEKLRRNNELKDAFLSSLAHELSESLGPMRTSLHLRRTSGDPKAQVRANEILETQLARQAQLVQTLAESSELLSGRARISVRSVDLRDVVSTVAQARLRDAEGAELDLTYAVPATAVRVMGDAARLQQALNRVLDNSFRCTPSGGVVSITLEERDGQARLTVKDTGVGIDPRALPHLFEPFFKPTDEPARSLSGLGLGLSVVASVLQLHGGTVSIDSEGCGRGAVIEIRMPLVPLVNQRTAERARSA